MGIDRPDENDRRPPVVVALHGQPGSARDFEPLREALNGDVELLALDRPGWGASMREAAGGFGRNADAVVRALDEAGVERAAVLGHSWGGGAALAVAGRHPDRVDGLVLAASIAPGALTFADRVLATPRLGRLATAVGMSLLRVGLTLPIALGTGKVVTNPSAWAAASFHAEQRALFTELDQLASYAGQVRAPTVVVTGSRDHVVPPAVSTWLVDKLPGAELRIVPGVGHRLLDQAPDALAAAVRQVLRRGHVLA